MIIDVQLVALLSSLRDGFVSEFRACCEAIPGALDAIRDAFIATADCCFSAFNAMMPAMFSKAKRSPPKPSSLTASPSTTTEGAVTLQALSLPPTTPHAGDEDASNPTGSPQEPSAFPDVVDDTDDDVCVASAEADLSAMHLNEHIEVPPALTTIAEESDSHGSSPAVSLTVEEAELLLTTMDGVVQSSMEAIEAVAKAEQCLRELEESQDFEETNQKPTSSDGSDATDADDAKSALVCATNSVEDIADDGDGIFHDAQDGMDADCPTTEAGVLEVAQTMPFEQYGSDDDEGSSVYSFATTAPSFAGDENAAPSIVSSPFWEERTSRPHGVASPHHRAWNPDWMEHQSPVQSSVLPDAEALKEAHDGGTDQVVAATAPPLGLQVKAPLQQDIGHDDDRVESPLTFKQEEEAGKLIGVEEVRIADVVPADPIDVPGVGGADHVVVVDETPIEDAESVDVPNLVELPLASFHFPCLDDKVQMDQVDGTSVNDEHLDEPAPVAVAPLPTPPRSYVPSFTGIPSTVTKGVSYRQLSVELNAETEGESHFYRVALQKLKQERQLRRLNPTVLEPIVSAPSSNKSVYDDEDEEERRARLTKIDELRNRTSAFEVKIGKPLSVGRVPHVKS